MNYDIAVIGAGPGGYVAAIRAAQLGAKTALIEKDEVGGTCLNWGCIPTKAIIASVKTLASVKDAAEMGILASEPKADITAIMARKSKVVAGLVKGIHFLIKANKVDHMRASARFTSAGTLDVGGNSVTAKNIIIATGSKWRALPGIDVDGRTILSSNEILSINEVPKSIIILGGGVIGCEFASILNALGTEVTIVEALPEIMALEDEATGKLLARSFKRAKIKIITGTTMTSVKNNGASVEAVLSNGETLTAEKMLISVGRVPNTDGLGADAVGIKMERGAIITDEKMRTNVAGVYAIGDVNGKYMLAHVASEEGIVAVENIMGHDAKMSYDAVPRPVFTHPEIAGVGATEKELKERNIEFVSGKFPYAAVSKAVCDGDTEGSVTIHAEKATGRVLGAQLIGVAATELMHEIGLAIRNGLKVADIYSTIHAHPTLSEAVMEAARDVEEKAIHKAYK